MSASLVAAFMAETAIVSYRQFSAPGGVAVAPGYPSLPLPANYTAPVVFYGVLAVIPGRGAHVAAMIGWGFVIATLLRLWDPTLKKPAGSGAVGTQTTTTTTQPAAPSVATLHGG